jgi:hypothetical protein
VQKSKSILFFKLVIVLFFVLNLEHCLSAQDYITINDGQNKALLYDKVIKTPLYPPTYPHNNSVANSEMMMTADALAFDGTNDAVTTSFNPLSSVNATVGIMVF